MAEKAITARLLAEQLVSGVLKAMASDPKPPCDGGSKPMWNVAVRSVLRDMGTNFGYRTYLEWCRLDVMWWGKSPERMMLVAESEMASHIDGVEDDFEKMPSYKCPFKLLVFSTDVEGVKKNAEGYLQLFGQHVKDEEYLLIGFTASGPRCPYFKVPTDGKLDRVEFTELRFGQQTAA
ncbi:MAG: hypothetical protein WB711_13275 [Terriglobales bacterium]|jgi:hypothetical protein